MSKAKVAEYSYAYFIDRGYSPQAAAAIVGNFEHESGFNTKAIHDEGTGFGIAGWRDPPGEKNGRRRQLKNYAERNRMNPDSLEAQLQFADHELRTTEKRTGNALKRAKTVEEANVAMMHYERPEGYSVKQPQAGLGYSSRLAKAKNALASYAGSAVDNPDLEERDDRQPTEFVDNTDTEAIPIHDMEWDEDSLEAAADAAEPAPTMGSRIKSGIKGLLSGMGSSESQQPLDYTPAGESNLQTDYSFEGGAIPVDGYKRYMNFADGGNVDQGFIDPHEWFAMVEGAR